MTSLNLEDLLKDNLKVSDAEVIKAFKAWGVKDPSSGDW